MPTYDYKCISCGDEFEIFQAMSEPPLKICSRCNGELKRLIGPGLGPIFKGNGFYQTDYKNNSSKKISKETSKAEKADRKSSNKSDAN
jgi:putative FmdB family regulatory protein